MEVVGPLSYTVWSEVLGGFIGGVTPSSPLYPVTKVEDISSGTIRVYVQEHLTPAEKDRVGRQIFTLGAFKNTDLQAVVVRDLSGIDKNYFRRNIQGIPQ